MKLYIIVVFLLFLALFAESRQRLALKEEDNHKWSRFVTVTGNAWPKGSEWCSDFVGIDKANSWVRNITFFKCYPFNQTQDTTVLDEGSAQLQNETRSQMFFPARCDIIIREYFRDDNCTDSFEMPDVYSSKRCFQDTNKTYWKWIFEIRPSDAAPFPDDHNTDSSSSASLSNASGSALSIFLVVTLLLGAFVVAPWWYKRKRQTEESHNAAYSIKIQPAQEFSVKSATVSSSDPSALSSYQHEYARL